MTDDINQLTFKINGIAMAIHREVGPGLDEIVYHEKLSEMLDEAGIKHQYKPRGRLVHRGFSADEFEADMILPGVLCLECKAKRARFAPENFCQVMCYQKFWGIRTGLLLNFGLQSLVIKRLLLDEPDRVPLAADELLQSAPSSIRAQVLARDIARALVSLHVQYGLGYRSTTCRGLLFAELKAEGIPCTDNPTILIPGRGKVRQVTLDCLLVNAQCAVMVLALQECINAADRAVLQTFVKHLGAAWGMAVNFGKQHMETAFVCGPSSSDK